jgi:DNA invertase Pin-like site-specific DNA recombinase
MVKHARKFVSYLRVSTDKQGLRGLGIAAQRQAVLEYLDGGKWQLVAEFVEQESGKRSDRPERRAAVQRRRTIRLSALLRVGV